MKRLTKKILSIFLAVLMLLGAVPLDGFTGIKAHAAVYGYSGSVAAEYAKQWWNGRNTAIWSDYDLWGGDCANFVCQSLYAGGIPMTPSWYFHMRRGRNKYGYTTERTDSFPVVTDMKNYISSLPGTTYIEYPSANQVAIGDVMVYNWGNDNEWDHCGICTDIINGVPQIACHTSNSLDTNWKKGAYKYAVIKLYGYTCESSRPGYDVYRVTDEANIYQHYGPSKYSERTYSPVLYDFILHITETQYDSYGTLWGRCKVRGVDGWVNLSGTTEYVTHVDGYYIDHNWGNWVVKSVADCLHDGLSERVCKRCGKVEQSVTKGGHVPDKEASCLEPSVCKVCSTVLASAKGHDATGPWKITKQPTCTEKGEKTLYCKRVSNGRLCNAVLEKGEVPPLGHKFDVGVTSPTCTQDGTQTNVCSRCGYTEAVLINEDNRWSDWTTDVLTLPEGKTESKIQYRCADKETTTSTSSSLSGWTLDTPAYTVNWNGAVNYFENYQTTSDTYRYVGTIKKTYLFRYRKKIGNEYDYSTQQLSGYEEEGYWVSDAIYAYDKYNSGNDLYASDEAISLGGSDYPFWKGETKDFYGYQSGTKIYNYYRWKDWIEWRDPYIASSDTRKVETRTVYRYDLLALGHDFTVATDKAYAVQDKQLELNDDGTLKDPLCYSSGYTCSRCGAVSPDSESENHVIPDWETEQDQYELISGSDSDVEIYRAYCKNDCGCYVLRTVKKCVFEVKEQIAPTCTTDGYTVYVCKEHGEEYTEKSEDKLGHDCKNSPWEIIKEPTCTEKGEKQRKCIRYDDGVTCDYIETKPIDASGHKLTKFDAIAPTCTEGGNTEYYQCNVCKKYFEDKDAKTEIEENSWILDKLGHDLYDHTDYDENGKRGWYEINCKQDQRDCQRDCGYSEYRDKDNENHEFEEIETKAPTCTINGFTRYECKKCHEVGYTEYTDSLGHIKGDTTVVYPTCEDPGYSQWTCQRDGCQETYSDGTIGPHIERFDFTDETGHGLLPTDEGYGEADENDQMELISSTPNICGGGTVDTYQCRHIDKNTNVRCTYQVTVGSDENHEMGEWTVVTPATCEEPGVEQRICTKNNDCTQTRVIQPTGHDYEAGDVVAPTCTENGYTLYVCQNNSEHTYKGDEVSALGHDYEVVVTDPTCLENGKMTYECSRGDSSYEAEVTNSNTWSDWTTEKHDLPASKIKTATQYRYSDKIKTTSSTKSDEYGTLCDTTYEIKWGDTTYLDSKLTISNETERYVDVVEKTYLYRYRKMKDGEYVYSVNLADKLLRKYEEEGYWVRSDSVYSYDTYSSGNDLYMSDEVINMSGSNFNCLKGETKTYYGYQMGTKVYTYHYENWSDWSNWQNTPVAKNDNREVETRTVYSYNVEALGHDYGSWVDDGNGTTHTKTCQRTFCNDTVTEHKISANHNMSEIERVPAKCKENGYIKYKCDDCDYTYTDTTTLKALGHDYGSWVDDGNEKTHTKTCQRTFCNDTVTEHKTSANHKMSEVERVEAKCKENGYIKYKCDDCDYTYTDTTTLKALGHDYGSWVDDENGKTHTKTCQRTFCNDTVTEHKISANHKMSEIERVPAKCKENGYVKYKCDDCDYTYTDTTTLEALGHDYGAWVDDGNEKTHTKTCQRDNCTDAVEDHKITADHDMNEWDIVKEADYGVEGLKKRTCKHCEYEETESIPALVKKTYTATFVIDDEQFKDYKEIVIFEEGATSIENPAFPEKKNYVGKWDDYELKNEDIIITGRFEPLDPDNVVDMVTDKTAEAKDGKAIITLSSTAASKFINVIDKTAKPVDVVFVLDQSGSMNEEIKVKDSKGNITTTTKRKKLIECANSFAEKIYNNAVKTGADHRIALVGFAMHSTTQSDAYKPYSNTGVLMDNFGNSTNYRDLNNNIYRSAFIPVNNDTGAVNELITKGINSVEASGATAADLGLEMAQNILALNPDDDGKRERIVIFITDGVPTKYSETNEDNVVDVAKAAVSMAKTIKNTADIYTVAIYDKADPKAQFTNDANGYNSKAKTFDINRFLHIVSSNYPNAEGMNEYGAKENDGFYMSVNNDYGDSFEKSFDKILYSTVYSVKTLNSVSFYDTLSKNITLTLEDENIMRADLKKTLGLSDSDISVTRNADGTTLVRFDHVPVSRIIGEDGKPYWSASVTFAASLNENALDAGEYNTNTNDAGVEVDGSEAGTFKVPTINIKSDRNIIVFKINDVVYRIWESDIGDKVEVPITDLATWNIPENTTVTDRYTEYFAQTVSDKKYTVTWNINGEKKTAEYVVGDTIIPPEVASSDELTFAGWTPSVSKYMPSNNIEYTAVFKPAHTHNYNITVKVYGTCDKGLTEVKRCNCGEESSEKLEPSKHTPKITLLSESNYTYTVICDTCGTSNGQVISVKTSSGGYRDQKTSYLDLTLYENNVSVQPDGKIEIRIPLTKEMENKTYKVYRINENGQKVSINSWEDDGWLVFEADHFSIYAICETDGNSNVIDEPTYQKAMCKLNGHKYTSVVTAPTCTEGGYTTYTCSVCGDSYVADATAKLGHNDSNGDGKCDNCGQTLETISSNCDHLCHSTNGFVQFIWKIVRFFCKLFNTNKVCSCGVKHW